MDRASFESDVLAHYRDFPETAPEAFAARQEQIRVRTFDRDSLVAAGKTLAILATYEDEARVFVGGLMKRHSGGEA